MKVEMNNKVSKGLLVLIASVVFAVSFFSYQYMDGGTPQIQKVNKPKSLPSVATAPKEVDDAMRKDLPRIIDFFDNLGISDFGRPYKLHGVDLSGVKTLNPNEKDAALSIIRSDYTWMYPLLDSSGKIVESAELEKDNGKWRVYSTGGTTEFEFVPGGDELANYLAEHGIIEVKEIKRFPVWAARMEFLYVNSGENQYLIPLDQLSKKERRQFENGRPYTLSLEHKKLYPASEALTKIIDFRIKSNVDDGGWPLAGS